MGWNNVSSPEMFLMDGKQITSPKLMANIQIDVFQNKVKKLLEALPPKINDPLQYLKTAIHRWGQIDNLPTLDIQPVDSQQILSVIKGMNKSHAFGHE